MLLVHKLSLNVPAFITLFPFLEFKVVSIIDFRICSELCRYAMALDSTPTYSYPVTIENVKLFRPGLCFDMGASFHLEE